MKTFEFIIPSVEDIEIGDIVVVNKNVHTLIPDIEDRACPYCSLMKLCSGTSFCGNKANSIFKKSV